MLRCYSCSNPDPVPISSSYLYYVPDTVERDGVLCQVISLKPISNSDFFKDLISTDFSINNLQSLGAKRILSTEFRSDASKLSFVDQFQDVNIKLAEDV